MVGAITGLVILSASVRLNKVSAQAEPKRIEIKAKRFSYEPSELTLKKGEPVTLVLTSEDVPHGVRFRELNVDLRAKKGESSEVQFAPDKTGEFKGHCSTFCGAGHGSMMLTLHVVN